MMMILQSDWSHQMEIYLQMFYTLIRPEQSHFLLPPDECDNNTILGLSIEQEESHCIVNGRDPGIYIHSDLCNGNVITTNYNFAKTVFASPVVQGAFCQNNTLKDWDNDCNGAITTDCPSNE